MIVNLVIHKEQFLKLSSLLTLLLKKPLCKHFDEVNEKFLEYIKRIFVKDVYYVQNI